jgi:hypothetical protein
MALTLYHVKNKQLNQASIVIMSFTNPHNEQLALSWVKDMKEKNTT